MLVDLSTVPKRRQRVRQLHYMLAVLRRRLPRRQADPRVEPHHIQQMQADIHALEWVLTLLDPHGEFARSTEPAAPIITITPEERQERQQARRDAVILGRYEG